MRASWKGYLKVAELSFEVALYAAASTAERISFHTINRKTGNRVSMEFIDEGTEKPVERDKQVKGYRTDSDDYVILQPEEIAEAVPESDKVLRVEAFIACTDVDTAFFDRPYFLGPSGASAGQAYGVLHKGMRDAEVAALARTVLFRRLRPVLVRAGEDGFIAHTLNFDYEVRSSAAVFKDLPEIKIKGEMLDLAKHIIKSKAGKFDPRKFDDRYEQAVAELVKAKQEGREIKAPKRAREAKVVSLMQALRESAKMAEGKATPAKRRKAS
jgi:DNA end-binding protein Ku